MTLEAASDGGSFSPLTTLDGTATSFVDASGLSPAITYSYEISATNLAGNSGWSNVASAAPLMQISPPWTDADIGGPATAGSAFAVNGSPPPAGGSIVVNGAGSGITGAGDQFNFAYVPLTGNVTLIANVASQGDTNSAAEAGVMVRTSLAANSACAAMVLTPGDGAAFQYRSANGGTMSTTYLGAGVYLAPDWVELVYNGSTITGYVSANGSAWTQVGTVTMSIAIADAGLCVASDTAGQSSAATFKQISINGSTNPAAPTGLTATPASGTSVALAWTNHDNSSVANQVYWEAPGAASFSWIATVPANATSYLDTGLTPGDSYSYQVLASNTVGSTVSNTAVATTPVPPLAVSELQPAGISTTAPC